MTEQRFNENHDSDGRFGSGGLSFKHTYRAVERVDKEGVRAASNAEAIHHTLLKDSKLGEVGFMKSYIKDGGKTAEIANVNLEPGFRNQGLGDKLYNEHFQNLKEAGVEKIFSPGKMRVQDSDRMWAHLEKDPSLKIETSGDARPLYREEGHGEDYFRDKTLYLSNIKSEGRSLPFNYSTEEKQKQPVADSSVASGTDRGVSESVAGVPEPAGPSADPYKCIVDFFSAPEKDDEPVGLRDNIVEMFRDAFGELGEKPTNDWNGEEMFRDATADKLTGKAVPQEDWKSLGIGYGNIAGQAFAEVNDIGPQGEPIFRFSEDQPRDPDGRFASGGDSAWTDKDGNRKFPTHSRVIETSPFKEGPREDYKRFKRSAFEAVKTAPVQQVKVDSLVTGQPVLDADRLKPFDKSSAEPIEVIHSNGNNWVVQGNHRAAAAWVAKENTISAHVLDLDKAENEKYLRSLERRCAIGPQGEPIFRMNENHDDKGQFASDPAGAIGDNVVFHGTSEKFGNYIQKEGLLPLGGGLYGKGTYASDDRAFAMGYAQDSANQAAEDAGIPKSQRSDLRLAVVVAKHDESWEPQLDGKVFVARSAVPPEKIERIEFYRLGDLKEKAQGDYYAWQPVGVKYTRASESLLYAFGGLLLGVEKVRKADDDIGPQGEPIFRFNENHDEKGKFASEQKTLDEGSKDALARFKAGEKPLAQYTHGNYTVSVMSVPAGKVGDPYLPSKGAYVLQKEGSEPVSGGHFMDFHDSDVHKVSGLTAEKYDKLSLADKAQVNAKVQATLYSSDYEKFSKRSLRMNENHDEKGKFTSGGGGSPKDQKVGDKVKDVFGNEGTVKGWHGQSGTVQVDVAGKLQYWHPSQFQRGLYVHCGPQGEILEERFNENHGEAGRFTSSGTDVSGDMKTTTYKSENHSIVVEHNTKENKITIKHLDEHGDLLVQQTHDSVGAARKELQSQGIDHKFYRALRQ